MDQRQERQTNNTLEIREMSHIRNWSSEHCRPCEGGVDPMNHAQAATLIRQIPGWELSADAKTIIRRCEFKNFYKTMAFVNAVAWVAHEQNHHPDLSAGYDYCAINYTTHAIGGLSENDFICAARINEVLGTD